MSPRARRSARGSLVASAAVTLALLASAPPRATAAPRDGTTLQVFAAASLAEAFGALGKRFEAEHPGVRVRFNFAGSQALARQIEQGAAADVIATADTRTMELLRAAARLAGEPAPFTRNRLVVIVPRANPARIARLADLARPGVKLVIAAETVPAGAYARQVIAKLARAPAFPPGFERRVVANVVSQEENVRAVVGKVQLGEADAGFVYRSDVSPRTARLVRIFEIPPEWNVVSEYPIAVIRGAPAGDLAREFVNDVRSPAGQAVLRRYGFLGPRAGNAAPGRTR